MQCKYDAATSVNEDVVDFLVVGAGAASSEFVSDLILV